MATCPCVVAHGHEIVLAHSAAHPGLAFGVQVGRAELMPAARQGEHAVEELIEDGTEECGGGHHDNNTDLSRGPCHDGDNRVGEVVKVDRVEGAEADDGEDDGPGNEHHSACASVITWIDYNAKMAFNSKESESELTPRQC